MNQINFNININEYAKYSAHSIRKIKENYKKNFGSQECHIAIGNFDGLHIGHNALINNMFSKKSNAPLLLLKFSPHPRIFFRQQNNARPIKQHAIPFNMINNEHDWLSLIEQSTAINGIITWQFNQQTANLSAQEFIDILLHSFPIKEISVGADFHCGKDRSGNTNTLVQYSKANEIKKFKVNIIKLAENKEKKISSSRIREALWNSHFKQASSLLGYRYFFTSIVVKGQQLGRTLGFPTANLNISANNHLPLQYGIYAVKIMLEDQLLYGAANWGLRPQFNKSQPCFEVHIFNFDKDIYGKIIKILPDQFLHPEVLYPSINALKLGIAKDCQDIKKIFQAKTKNKR